MERRCMRSSIGALKRSFQHILTFYHMIARFMVLGMHAISVKVISTGEGSNQAAKLGALLCRMSPIPIAAFMISAKMKNETNGEAAALMSENVVAERNGDTDVDHVEGGGNKSPLCRDRRAKHHQVERGGPRAQVLVKLHGGRGLWLSIIYGGLALTRHDGWTASAKVRWLYVFLWPVAISPGPIIRSVFYNYWAPGPGPLVRHTAPGALGSLPLTVSTGAPQPRAVGSLRRGD